MNDERNGSCMVSGLGLLRSDPGSIHAFCLFFVVYNEKFMRFKSWLDSWIFGFVSHHRNTYILIFWSNIPILMLYLLLTFISSITNQPHSTLVIFNTSLLPYLLTLSPLQHQFKPQQQYTPSFPPSLSLHSSFWK